MKYKLKGINKIEGTDNIYMVHFEYEGKVDSITVVGKENIDEQIKARLSAEQV
jgi:uncharacterized protein (UPF0333 family)